MTPEILIYICLFLGLSAALVGGVFQSFSDFVMAGLIRSAPQSGIESMQGLNRTVFRSVFIATFLALVPISLGFAIYAWMALSGMPQSLIILAAILYLPLVFLVTAFGNVPMNERLEKMDATSVAAADYWQTYGRVWTRWNTIRTIGSIATAGCYLFASAQIS